MPSPTLPPLAPRPAPATTQGTMHQELMAQRARQALLSNGGGGGVEPEQESALLQWQKRQDEQRAVKRLERSHRAEEAREAKVKLHRERMKRQQRALVEERQREAVLTEAKRIEAAETQRSFQEIAHRERVERQQLLELGVGYGMDDTLAQRQRLMILQHQQQQDLIRQLTGQEPADDQHQQQRQHLINWQQQLRVMQARNAALASTAGGANAGGLSETQRLDLERQRVLAMQEEYDLERRQQQLATLSRLAIANDPNQSEAMRKAVRERCLALRQANIPRQRNLNDFFAQHVSPIKNGTGALVDDEPQAVDDNPDDNCPVCGVKLMTMPQLAQEKHLRVCLGDEPPSPLKTAAFMNNGSSKTVAEIKKTVSIVGTIWTASKCKALIDKECNICMEEFEIGVPMATMNCLCIYHEACIKGWFAKKRSCPEHF
ncbi:UNVERIFIED_CONTAM: hypothetical protein HDU68_011350 [Siphonaria sp. JEL0065]|nr:hypothetical protein HDU68_011350 [Siphonaria sp. JEL0065]